MKISSVKKQISRLGFLGTFCYYMGRMGTVAELEILGRFTGKFIKVKKNRLVFKNREKQDYSDNPRAFFEYLIKKGYNEKYKIIWMVSDKKSFRDHKYKNVKFVTAENKYGWSSPACIYYATTAGCFFYSHNSAGLNRYHGEGQKVINLWHGCGYKGAEHGDGKTPKRSDEDVKLRFDAALVPGPVFVETKSRAWGCDRKKLLTCGYPRYDWMLNPGITKKQLFEKLGIRKEPGTKVVMWMPTFRQSELNGCKEGEISMPYTLPGLSGAQELVELDRLLGKLNITLFIKKHPLQTKWESDTGELKSVYEITDQLLEEQGILLYELIGLCDGLISDYSSIAVDYLLLDRPMAFVLTDYRMYQEKRGFVFEDPLSYMPGEKIMKYEDFRRFFEDLAEGKDRWKEERKRLLPVMHTRHENYCGALLEALKL
nr:CDP-glycerol glycerophosphotransferase family protein [uncultured Blautia sp.]